MDLGLFATYFIACCAAGTTGALVRPGAWYESLSKPSWTPPDWAFPVVWTTLYILMSVSAAWVAVLPGSGQALALWSVQIAFNTLWTPIFFGLHKMRESLFVMVGLWLSVAATTLAFFQMETWAGVLMVPYLVWVTIAAALNLSLVRRNPVTA